MNPKKMLIDTLPFACCFVGKEVIITIDTSLLIRSADNRTIENTYIITLHLIGLSDWWCHVMQNTSIS